ncbi:hypothetical protein BFP77_12005 [Maribacter sp. 4U21]|uniref:hypothetical protein n=1 Tax=Maribacter sp. 4U21 TaxID=1889779 RepID=UPI000C157031|nr:hypothetical protein [Maribacter sp. 4U21]PIB27381.1 hypothetical protein BFP77_12005 [Maribacter sp. 4U21]
MFHTVSHSLSIQGHHHDHEQKHAHDTDFKAIKTVHPNKVEHGHSHEILAFLKNILGSYEDHRDQQQKTQELVLDKHLLNRMAWGTEFISKSLTNNNFDYAQNEYQKNRNVPTPPPKYFS